MLRFRRVAASLAALLLCTSMTISRAQASPAHHSPVGVSFYDRTRIDTWQWFAAPPQSETYAYVESLVRISVQQKIKHWDWQLELAQPSILHAPTDAVSSNPAQGQLGLGGTYYASNGNNDYPAAAFFKQGFLRYRFGTPQKSLRLGRFEFFEGLEIAQKNPQLAWLQANRLSQRLIANFGFTNAQRSVDGIEGHYGGPGWDVVAAAARSDQGVFNMNGNPELNVDFQYLALTRQEASQHVLWRAFAMGYHDGRTGLTKTDNRPLPVRQADHHNIRIGTYGGDLAAVIPAGAGDLDFLFWGALQNGSWGQDGHSANAVALEGGYKFTSVSTSPWLRGGWWRSSGDKHPTDTTHNTFFQMLPTPRLYARLPFYNLMNSTDSFVQVMDTPVKSVVLRSDLHWLQLTSAQDLWYQGGGAFDNKVFGYVGRPANGHSSFASVPDISADWQATKDLALNFYYAYAQGKSVVAAIYPANRNMQYGYVELVYRWGINQRGVKQ
ncbi:MAG: alginate export family protein [Terracidiphilus sp.]